MPLRRVAQPGFDPERYAQADRSAPGNPSALSAGWMTEAMRATGEIGPGHRVASVAVESLHSDGRAITGELCRAVVAYEPPEAGPATVIAKFASSDPVIKGLVERSDAYAREIFFYRDLAPLVPVRTPRHLGSGLTPGRSLDRPGVARVIDALPSRLQRVLTADIGRFTPPTKRRYALLIEDCSAGFTVHNLVSPPSPDLLAEALDALAELHARFWGGGPEVAGHPALGLVMTRVPRLHANEIRHRVLALVRAEFSDWWSADDEALVTDANDRLLEDLRALHRPMTLIHGDTRSDNVMFPAEDGPPVFLDWGMTSIANPAWDVSFLLGSSLQASSAEAADDLIAGYCRALADRGADFDEDGLRNDIVAGWRAQTLFIASAVRLTRDRSRYGENGLLHALWMPRILALLRRA